MAASASILAARYTGWHRTKGASVTWLVDMCDMTHSHMWHDSSMCVTWLIHTVDMTHTHVWHKRFFFCRSTRVGSKRYFELSLQHTRNTPTTHVTHCSTLQHTATHPKHNCDALQHTATYLQHICNTLELHSTTQQLHHTAPHCNTLQHTAPHLQHTATHCNTLQHN